MFGDRFSPDFAKQILGDGASLHGHGDFTGYPPAQPAGSQPSDTPTFAFSPTARKPGSALKEEQTLTPYYPFKEDVVHFHSVWKRHLRQSCFGGKLCQDEEGMR